MREDREIERERERARERERERERDRGFVRFDPFMYTYDTNNSPQYDPFVEDG